MKKSNLLATALLLGVTINVSFALSFFASGVEWNWAEFKDKCHADALDDSMYQLLFHLTVGSTAPTNAAVFLGPKNPKLSVPSGVLSVPRRVQGRPIIEIGNRAFEGHYELRKVNIPSTIRSIGIRAFSSCQYLEDVTIPESVVWFAPYCFSGCNNLTSFPIPENGEAVTLKDGAFSFCRGLTEVKLPKRIKVVHASVFANCENLAAVNFNGQDSIAAKAFENCKKLTRCAFPASLKTIGEEAFSGCSGLRSVSFEGEGPELYNDSFCDCTALESISLPERTVQLLVKGQTTPFSGCSKLKTIIIPENYKGTDFDFLKPSPDCKIEFKAPSKATTLEVKTIPLSERVSLKIIKLPNDIWFGTTEVTQAQWEAVMGTPSPVEEENNQRYVGPNKPVHNIRGEDAVEFFDKLNKISSVSESGLWFRLPSNLEWEYACLAGSSGPYCKQEDGTEISEKDLNTIAWFEEPNAMTYSRVHDVGMKKPNAFGLYDMLGNVDEIAIESDGSLWNWRFVILGGNYFDTIKYINPQERHVLRKGFKSTRTGFRISGKQKKVAN